MKNRKGKVLIWVLLSLGIYGFGISGQGKLIIQAGHSGQVLSVAFSPDGKYLVSGGQEGGMKVWEVGTGRIVYAMPHGGPVHSVSFSPDGKAMASASMDGKIRFWDMATGELVRETPGTQWWDERHTGTVAFSKDWKYVAIIKFIQPAVWPAKCNTRTEIREVKTGTLVSSYETKHKDQGTCVAFSPDNKIVAVGARGWTDPNVKLLDTNSGEVLHKLGAGWLYYIAFSPDGKILSTCDRSGVVSWWNTETGEKIRTLKELGAYNWSNWSEFSPDGKIFVSGHDNTEIRFWDVKTGERITTLDGFQVDKEGAGICNLDISSDGKLLATAVGKSIGIWDIETKKLVRVLGSVPPSVLSADVSPDIKFIAFAGYSGMINLWDAKTGEMLSIKAHQMPINSVAFSPDGKFLASGGDDENILVWKAPELQKLCALKGNMEVLNATFSPDSKLLASSDFGEMINIWEVDSWQKKQVLQIPKGIHANLTYDMTFSPDGKLLASGSKDSLLRIWDLSTGKIIKDILVCTEPPASSMDYDEWLFRKWIYGVCFSPDGRSIATGEWGGWREGCIKIWSVENGETVQRIVSHKVICLAYSPDGKIIGSGGSDNTIRLWNVSTGKESGALEGHSDFITSICFSSDGKYLISSSLDGTAKVWDIESKKLVLTLFCPENGESIAYTPEGYYRCSKGAEKYILFTREGKTYTPSEYESACGWKNTPEKVTL